MKERQLKELLQSLPRERASRDFTPNLMRRVRSHQGSRSRPRLVRLAWATVVAGLLVVPVGVNRWQASQKREEARQRLETLRSQYRALEHELEELRRLAVDQQPIIRLGETEEFDFILDLRDLSPVEPDNARRVVY